MIHKMLAILLFCSSVLCSQLFAVNAITHVALSDSTNGGAIRSEITKVADSTIAVADSIDCNAVTANRHVKATAIEADSIYISGDLISDFAGDGLTVSGSNVLDADLGIAITSDEITDQTIVRADIDSTVTITVKAVYSGNSNEADSIYLTKDYCDANYTGAGVNYNDIADPTGDGSIPFAAWTGTYTSATSGWGGLIISNTVAEQAASGVLLTLKVTDAADIHHRYLVAVDGSDTVAILGHDGIYLGTAALADSALVTKGYGDANWAAGAGDVTDVIGGDGLVDDGNTGDITVDMQIGSWPLDLNGDSVWLDSTEIVTWLYWTAAYDSVDNWNNLVNDDRDSVLAFSPIVSEAKDSLTSWANEINVATDSLAAWDNLINDDRDSILAFSPLVNEAKDSLISWANEINEHTDSIVAWANLVNDDRDSVLAFSPLVSEAKDSLTSWANEINEHTDSIGAWANLVNDDRDSVLAFTSLVNEAKDSLTSWANEVNEHEDSVTAWANLINDNRDSATTHSPLVNEAKDSLTSWANEINEHEDSVTAWGNLVNDNRDSATTHSSLVNEAKDSLTAWANLVNNNRDSATTHSPLVNEAKDSLTSWADEVNTATDSLASWADKVNTHDDWFGTMTATDDNILVADDGDFESVAMSGDATIDNGAVTVSGLVGKTVNSSDPADQEVLTYYTTGDTLGWTTPAGGTIKWRDSAYVYLDTTKVIYDLIDTTTAKIPTAEVADSTDGGAIRSETSKEADSTDGGAIRSETCKEADSTDGGAARAQSAQGLIGNAINSTDPADGEYLKYYLTGDSLGWEAPAGDGDVTNVTGGYGIKDDGDAGNITVDIDSTEVANWNLWTEAYDSIDNWANQVNDNSDDVDELETDTRYLATIYNPNSLWSADTMLVLVDTRTPAAITVTRIDVTCDADPDTELDFDLMWCDAFIGNANRAVVDEMNTASGVVVITAGFDDATIAANKCIYIRFNAEPDAGITQVGVRVTYTID